MSGSGIPVRVPELAIDRDHRNDDPALSRRERPDPGDLQKMEDAWTKSMLLHLALWARPYVADCPWKAAARTQRKNVLKGWWRRRLYNLLCNLLAFRYLLQHVCHHTSISTIVWQSLPLFYRSDRKS